MKDRVREVLARHRPGQPVGPVVLLGGGVGHVAYLVDDALVVRIQRGGVADPDEVHREVALLAAVGRRVPLRVPDPVLVDPDAGVLAYRVIPGRSLRDRPVAEPTRLAPALGEFLTALHATPWTEVRAFVPRDDEPVASAAIADPAHDLALLRRDLGDDVLDAVLDAYGGPFDAADRERAVFFSRYALIEDLAYALRAGDDRAARAALAHLPRTFA